MKARASAVPRFPALRHRNFVLLWSGLIVSNIGTWIQEVGVGWLVLQLTDSPLWLGLLGLSFALPMILLPLVGGAVADRVDRIRLLYVTQTAQMLISFALAVLTWTGLINVWYILAASFTTATIMAFDNPARRALIPDLIPQQDLMNALSLSSMTFTGAALIGPAIAGALLNPLGVGALFFLDGISYLAVLIALGSMRDVRTRSGGLQASIGRSMLAGLAYAWRTRFVFILLMLATLTNLFGRSHRNLLPIFARDIWQSGADGYGFLLSAMGAGALVGAFGLAAVRQLKRQGMVMAISGLLFSASIILFALSPSFIMGIFLLFFSGAMYALFSSLNATFLQAEVPRELQGRIMSLYTITLLGFPALGAMGAGALAELLGGIPGAPRAVLIGGIIMLVALLFYVPSCWQRQTK